MIALGDSQYGVLVLPTVLYLSKVLAKLAMGLDRRPELIANILRMEGLADREENVEKVTLVEQSANVVREAFIKCLTDRSGTPGPHGKPEGKRVGIYLMANLCLKLLFQVRSWPHCVKVLADDYISAANCVMPSRCSRASVPSLLRWLISQPHSVSRTCTTSVAIFCPTICSIQPWSPCSQPMISAIARRPVSDT